MDCVIEKEKRVPVKANVDVIVDGSGVSGIFAALAAAGSGAETYLFCNDVGLFFWIEGIKWKEFNEYKEGYHLTEEDSQWIKETLEDDPGRFSDFLIPILRKVWNMGEHNTVSKLTRPELSDRIRVSSFPLNQHDKFPESMGSRTAFIGEIDSGNGKRLKSLDLSKAI